MTIDYKRFHINSTFVEQFCHTYNSRLKDTREALIRNSRDRWGEELENVPLEQLNAELGNKEVFVIGTLFKSMPKQPSILRELEDNEQYPTGPNVNFTSDEDSLVLHETDESVDIEGDIDVHMHVTGIPISLKGYQVNGGAKFHVIDSCYAGPDLSVNNQPPPSNGYHHKTRDMMLIVSGLEFGFDATFSEIETTKVINALRNLKEFIYSTQEATSGRVVKKFIIAGNSVAPGFTKSKLDLIGASEGRDNRQLNEVFRLFDSYVATLAQCDNIEIELMPGKNDPASFLLPQQPFHPRILPNSSPFLNVHPTTNPCIFKHKNLTILGTSGENVESIRQYSRIELSTTALKNTLEWGHIAPLAPDNLSCVPFKDYDPFVIDFEPDIYFAGNQPEFAATSYSPESKKKIQIISVPSFVRTLSGVVVDLENLEVEVKSFK